MELPKQVCSLELAKKLKELGVKQESLFFYLIHPSHLIYKGYAEKYPPKIKMEGEAIDTREGDYAHIDVPDIAAFTVSELGEMLPWKVLVDGERQVLSYTRGNEEQNDGFQWMVSYLPVDDNDLKIVSTCGSTEADARAKMLVYLIENDLIKI